jgi:glucose-1-phosphate thymidylyltransferase
MCEHVEDGEFVGIIPAAGIASRLKPSRYAKELLPVAYLVDDHASATMPVPVITLSLRALKTACVRRCVVAISDRKPELMRFVGDGSEFGLQVAYVQQTLPSGLSRAVELASSWVRDCYTCLLLPDTIIYPATAMSTLCEVMRENRADVVLGVFPTDTPQQLGPVRFSSNGRVQEVFDKPESTNIYNTWAMAVWSPAFGELLHDCLQKSENQPLGVIFNEAVKLGMDVRASWFPDGSFVDIGTVKGLSKMLQLAEVFEFAAAPEPGTSAAAA